MSLHSSPWQTHLLPDSATISSQGVLHIAGNAVSELAQNYGTPLYIFDQQTIENACQSYQQAFEQHYTASAYRFVYASKAYLSPLVAQIVHKQGMGLDVVSGGEIMVAQKAAIPMSAISFHGNNKSEEELRLALRLNVGHIILDNWSELRRLARLAAEEGIKASVLVRVAPDVQTDTHRYLQTGHASAKFGFPLSSGEAKAAILQLLQDEYIEVAGIHAHTGTMLRETRPYEECVERLLELAYAVHQETGWWPKELSPGGGWGVATSDHTEMPAVVLLAQALQKTMTALQQRYALPLPTLVLEPGRSIIARAGIALYRIGAQKLTPGGINYLFVDGGMADNIRPALYGAHYTALAAERCNDSQNQAYCISGRYCESGDMLIEQVMLPEMQEGDLLCLPLAGAYCLPMASNYNLVPRPAVLLVNTEQTLVMERRETYEDILQRYTLS